MAESAIDRRFQEVFGNTKGGAGSGNFGHGGRPGEVGGSSSGWTSESGGGSSDTGGTVVRETDKAILYRHSSGQYEEAWLPKSQITIEGDKVTVPDWIRDKKFISATIEIGGAN